MSKSYKLILIADLSFEAQIKILDMRNQYAVRKWMFSDHIIGKDEHIQWIERLKTDDRQRTFAIVEEESGAIVGVTGVNNIDDKHKKAFMLMYLDEMYQSRGFGAVIEFHTLNYCFDCLKLDKLNCEVIDGNAATLRLHAKFLFQNEGFIRENVIKDGKRVGVHLLGITRKEWDENRFIIEGKYGSFLSRYSVAFFDTSGAIG
ncbi:MAG: UDP-4-amino-4,6-dideoxy-N-acetyl-beta-L-altrosamine N-acetyltransferase [Helicobacteraceae bacterium]|nr:UDP-4-amino-4,6-dideoxy-N-acetyl-beta-L-altrosamine N-acetyltransferase [Helicobacteraceae bacterium]